jgi:hypothetical protein
VGLRDGARRGRVGQRGPLGWRLPGAIELPWARRRRLRAERGTVALGVAAFGLTGTVLGSEVVRMLRDRMHAHPELDPLETADVAVRETVAVAVAGLESLSPRETALMNLLASFSLTFATARLGTYLIRRRGPTGPFRDMIVGERHIHHFVPGIVMAFLAGGASVLSRNESLDPVLAVPFGMGVALTLDESALLLQLDDVYWNEDGIISVQITLAALALLSSTTLARRALRRGERRLRAMRPPRAAARPASI